MFKSITKRILYLARRMGRILAPTCSSLSLPASVTSSAHSTCNAIYTSIEHLHRFFENVTLVTTQLIHYNKWPVLVMYVVDTIFLLIIDLWTTVEHPSVLFLLFILKVWLLDHCPKLYSTIKSSVTAISIILGRAWYFYGSLKGFKQCHNWVLIGSLATKRINYVEVLG